MIFSHNIADRKPRYIFAKTIVMSLLCALPASFASAQTATDTFLATASIGDSCTVTAGDLAFGTYDPFSATPLDATSSIDVLCTTSTTYDVGLDEGVGAGATVASRKMTSSGNLLNYTVYSDAGRTTVWGDTIATDTVAGTGTGSTQNLTAYGRVFALQSQPPGAYQDTVTVTISF